MKKALSTILAVLFILLNLATTVFTIAFFWRPAFVVNEYIGNDQIYVGEYDNGDNVIICFSKNKTVTIYQYREEMVGNLSFLHSCYGIKTVYDYKGVMFNKLIWNLHYFPRTNIDIWGNSENSLGFFDNYAIYDDAKKQKAFVSTKPISFTGLNLDPDSVSLSEKPCKDVLIIKEDRIVFADESYHVPNNLELSKAKSIIALFEKDGLPLK